MTKNPKTKVIDVKEAPTLKNPFIQQGIRDAASATAWGEKNGHAVVYFLAKKQRVYAERLKADVAAVAKEIQQRSEQLVLFAEGDL